MNIEEGYDVLDYTLQELKVDQLEPLDNEAVDYVKQTLEYMSLDTSLIDQNGLERKAYILSLVTGEVEAEPEEVKILINYLKLQANTYVIVSKAKNENQEIGYSYSVELNTISNSEGGKLKTVVTFDDGVRIGEYEVSTEESTLYLPDLLKEEVYTNGDPSLIDAQVSVPCIQNGCCTFSGVKYKWCGAGCGSGTPINALDRCCRTHDYCYGSFKSYPDRCACDRNLRSCAANTNDPGKTTLRTGIWGKMVGHGC